MSIVHAWFFLLYSLAGVPQIRTFSSRLHCPGASSVNESRSCDFSGKCCDCACSLWRLCVPRVLSDEGYFTDNRSPYLKRWPRPRHRRLQMRGFGEKYKYQSAQRHLEKFSQLCEATRCYASLWGLIVVYYRYLIDDWRQC